MSLVPLWLNWPQTRSLVQAFLTLGPDNLRFVGGAVRDALLGIDAVEVDAATPLTPDETMALLARAGIRAIPTGLAHGTITALIGAKSFEITTLRRDETTDGRHAEVAFTTDWKEDAARRDFTMNAIYLSPAGELFDYFGGQADAKAGRVRFIGDAGKRIEEDYLRILRFFRFHAHYATCEADKQALAAIKTHAAGLSGISGERIQQEMLKLLAARTAGQTLYLMQSCGVDAFGAAVDIGALGELDDVTWAEALTPAPLLKLAALLQQESALAPLAARWKLSGEMQKYLQVVLKNLNMDYSRPTLAEQKALLRRIGAHAFCDVTLLLWARSGADKGRDFYEPMLHLAGTWQAPAFPLRGEDLLAAGMSEGRQMGERLRAAEAAWERSDYTLSKDELLKL